MVSFIYIFFFSGAVESISTAWILDNHLHGHDPSEKNQPAQPPQCYNHRPPNVIWMGGPSRAVYVLESYAHILDGRNRGAGSSTIQVCQARTSERVNTANKYRILVALYCALRGREEKTVRVLRLTISPANYS